MKKITCPFCNDNYTTIDGLYTHIELEHIDELPSEFTVSQYLYYLKTGKDHGTCVMCKRNTDWNEHTGKYNRFCSRPICKEKYKKIFQQRMIGKYGKTTLLNDPDQQKKMLANRKISGVYKWSDGTQKTYTGTYELDFLKMLDVFMNYDSEDIISPSPHTYYYIYQGEKKFYIPDMYIASLNLEIEIKQGGDNPNLKPNMVNIDKVKEKLKDEVMNSQNGVNYIKIVNKNYDNFFEYLNKEKEKYIESRNIDLSEIIRESNTTIHSLIPDNILNETIENYDDNLDVVMKKDFIKIKCKCCGEYSNCNSDGLCDKCKNENNALTEVTNEELYPVYIVLFSNDTEIGKLIRKATKSDYSHASITLDPSLNNMYSFSNIPYSTSLGSNKVGFVRESLWSPMFKRNRFFTVMVTFVNKDSRDEISRKIEYFKQNYTKFKYNDIGLIEYYLHFKNNKKPDETKKIKWFCSEFVTYMLNSGHIDGFENIMQSPQDIRNSKNVMLIHDYTLETFSEDDIREKTEEAKKEFMKHSTLTESCEIETEVLEEGLLSFLKNIRRDTGMSKDIEKYSAILDWKELYHEFTNIFKKTDPIKRFDLIELIIIKYIIPFKKSTEKATDEIISEMKRIRNILKTSIINNIDIITGSIIIVTAAGILKTIIYPEMTLIGESSSNILNESKLEYINDKGKEVPKVCPICGCTVGVFIQGEPVFLCTNKKCHKYFGTVPFKESTEFLDSFDSGDELNDEEYINYLDEIDDEEIFSNI